MKLVAATILSLATIALASSAAKEVSQASEVSVKPSEQVAVLENASEIEAAVEESNKSNADKEEAAEVQGEEGNDELKINNLWKKKHDSWETVDCTSSTSSSDCYKSTSTSTSYRHRGPCRDGKRGKRGVRGSQGSRGSTGVDGNPGDDAICPCNCQPEDITVVEAPVMVAGVDGAVSAPESITATCLEGSQILGVAGVGDQDPNSLIIQLVQSFITKEAGEQSATCSFVNASEVAQVNVGICKAICIPCDEA